MLVIGSAKGGTSWRRTSVWCNSPTRGLRAAKETTQRVAEWDAKVESMGVRIKQMYWSTGRSVRTTKYVFSRRRTIRPPPVYYCLRIPWATFGRRRCALSRASRWRRSSPISRERGKSELFREREKIHHGLIAQL